MIKIIAAIDPTGLLGIDQKIPWNRRADLQRFKDLTINHTVVMGRKTFDSLQRPQGLPNRRNVVISRQALQLAPGIKVENNLASFLKNEKVISPLGLIWIIGGAEIYQQALSEVDQIDLTILRDRFTVPAGSVATFFPSLPYNFTIVKEEVNSQDPSLLHRLYEPAIW